MDHPSGVGVGYRLADRLEDRQETGQVVGGRFAPAKKRRKRLPFHQLHGEERPAVGKRAELVDRHDAGVLKLAADLGLLDEPVDQVGPVAVLVEEDLQARSRLSSGSRPLSTAPIPPRAISPSS